VRLAGLLLAACTAREQTVVVWEKPGASPAELEAARADCAQRFDEVAAETADRRPRYQADESGRAFVQCMAEHGFSWRTQKVPTRP
jgi:hypothetical protein